VHHLGSPYTGRTGYARVAVIRRRATSITNGEITTGTAATYIGSVAQTADRTTGGEPDPEVAHPHRRGLVGQGITAPQDVSGVPARTQTRRRAVLTRDSTVLHG
jgi:hypothetical protein